MDPDAVWDQLWSQWCKATDLLTWGLGECYELPQQGLQWNPGRKPYVFQSWKFMTYVHTWFHSCYWNEWNWYWNLAVLKSKFNIIKLINNEMYVFGTLLGHCPLKSTLVYIGTSGRQDLAITTLKASILLKILTSLREVHTCLSTIHNLAEVYLFHYQLKNPYTKESIVKNSEWWLFIFLSVHDAVKLFSLYRFMKQISRT